MDLYNPDKKTICEFKAPTGSGKTLMSSAFISEMILRNSNDKFIFVIATPSSSDLPLFFEQKINKYKIDLPYSKFEVEYIKSPSSAQNDKTESISKIIPQQNKVYIFGKSSFGKGRILSEYKIIDDFILSAMADGFKLIYIRDEAHIGGNRFDNGEQAQNFENLMQSNASFVLKMTATPTNSPLVSKVILTEKELNNPLLNENKWLLKTHAVSLLDSNLENDEILEHAISKFKRIKQQYAELNIGINPAMLIQVDNTPGNKDMAKEYETTLAKTKQTLNDKGLAWVQYFGDSKDSNRVYGGNFSLDDITKNNNDIDAVIFKIGPATGWDIPRACMLIQLRRVSSTNLNIQTLGRIKRNPYPDLERNPVTDNYYIYSNKPDDAAAEVVAYNYKVRDKFYNETFLSIDIDNKKELQNSQSLQQFQIVFTNWLKENKNAILGEISTCFIDNNHKYKKVISVANGHQIYSIISNPFIFLRDYSRLIAANKYIYNAIKNSVANFCQTENIKKEFLTTVLLTGGFKKKIMDLISKTKKCQPKYKICEHSYNPNIYQEIFSQEQITRQVSKRDYLFGINEDNTLNKNQQPLDSSPENFVFSRIYEFAEDNDDAIKIWAKNQTTSNIFGEYLDENYVVRRSYFDFIIKFKNGYYLYLEVKGEQDINPNKTELLKKAYEEYFKNRTDDLFTPNLAIAICKVNTISALGNISFADNIFYDHTKISENLNALSFDNLLKTLAHYSTQKT